MSVWMQKNIGAAIKPMSMLAATASLTAGGSGDNTTITSSSIDRQGIGVGSPPLSADFEVYYAATLASGATLSIAWTLQDSDDNSSFTDVSSQAMTVVATGPSGGGAVPGVARMTVADAGNPQNIPSVNLSGTRRYIRLLVRPDLSAAGTDTAVIKAVAGVFSGFDLLPAA